MANTPGILGILDSGVSLANSIVYISFFIISWEFCLAMAAIPITVPFLEIYGTAVFACDPVMATAINVG